ncbi:acyloxyacyl hydrolase [Aquiflexum sp.]|uniref:acyloxyacyl hydrolase n=1 Tax=Aquiflexum sp. TaxID=1872584 RepID=UPI00359395BC
MKKHLFYIFFLLIIIEASGQQVRRLGMEGSYGFIIPHSKELRPISESNPYGLSMHYQLLKQNKENWDACNCFHYVGIQASYLNFGNPEVLGSAYHLSGTFEPILWKKGPWFLSLLTGIGFSYLDQVYDPIHNPDNLFFSSPLSFLAFVNPKFEYRFGDDWGINLSLAYNHISNGGQSQPNKGINYPMMGIGINRYFESSPFPKYKKSVLPSAVQWYIETAYTHRESNWSEGRKPVFTVLGGFHKSFTVINALGAGIELTKDYSLEVEDNRTEALMPAPFIAHHLLFGRFDFNQRMAVYMNKPVGYHDFIFYQRYSLMYQVIKDFSMGFSLKVHGHVAENIDFRISYRF